jgi:hypothetical protein
VTYISTPANQEKQSKNLIIKSLQFAISPHLSKEGEIKNRKKHSAISSSNSCNSPYLESKKENRETY